MPEQQILELLKIHYGLDINALESFSGGADANARVYKAAANSNSYFVKIKFGHYDQVNLAIIKLLHDAGIKEIIFPILTRAGNLFQQFDEFLMIVYPFIQAPNGFTQDLTDKQWIQLGKALRQVHQTPIPESILQKLRKETYPNKWCDIVKSLYDKINLEISNDEISEKFKSSFKTNIELIHEVVELTEKLAKQLQPDLDEYVLCHSDIHAGNILVGDNESIYIIDWDEPMLAPKERDLMFIGGGVGNVWNNPKEIPYFYEGYGKTHLDKTILSYYRHARIVEDIALFGQNLLSSDYNDPARLEILPFFNGMFEPNGVVEIALSMRF